MKNFVPIILASALALCQGCGRERLSTRTEAEAREAAQKDMVSASALQDEGRLEEARNMFGKIVAEQPTNGLARLRYAILLQDVSPADPYAALCHFDAYLKLRPDAEKTALVNERMQQLRRQIARRFDADHITDNEKARDEALEQMRLLNIELTNKKNEIETLKKRLEKVEEENRSVRHELGRLQRHIDNISSGFHVSAPATRTYKVEKGDTLWRIARDILQDPSRNVEIAVLNGIDTDTPLVEGQVILIP